MPGTPSTRTTPPSPPVVTPVTEAAVVAASVRRNHAGHALAGDAERVACAARATATGHPPWEPAHVFRDRLGTPGRGVDR
ncbi:hypothetical protein [Streptosporangium sp. V21-05]|uniref:hypothetical protein n=1 Tax=Streptosporangium sp. V21-05 TaxID=3446115 RepID=UPI003F52FBDE